MTRTELHEKFEELGIKNVYFQPPESKKIQYPCLIYRLDDLPTQDADDSKYKLDVRYNLVYISKSPTDKMVHKLAMLPRSSFERFYTMDELNHYVYTIYA